MTRAVVFLAAAGLGLAACGRNTITDDKNDVAGAWTVLYSEREGSESDVPRKGTRYTFADAKVTIGDNALYSYSLEAAKEPKEIDFAALKGDDKMVLRGIYKVEKDRLTLCIGEVRHSEGKTYPSQRPTEFKSGQAINLLILKRA